jgi:DtxR family transcriptional regulator, Mn-dependent transcriptional regulator
MNTSSEENHIKAIYKLSRAELDLVSTNALSAELKVKASSITDMLQRLSEKKLVRYEKYKGVQLTKKGLEIALLVIRKHRLWETFLVRNLNFGWDEVHDIAEQLEHIRSSELVNRLDQFLGFPRVDPHGDPIPDKDGNIILTKLELLSRLDIGQEGVISNIMHQSKEFLGYLDKNNLVLGTQVQVTDRLEFDASIGLQIQGVQDLRVSKEIADQILIDVNSAK